MLLLTFMFTWLSSFSFREKITIEKRITEVYPVFYFFYLGYPNNVLLIIFSRVDYLRALLVSNQQEIERIKDEHVTSTFLLILYHSQSTIEKDNGEQENARK